jgi:hypothetical protein
VEKEADVLSVNDSRKFEVHCSAGDAGELCVGTDSASIQVGQRLGMDKGEEIWHSVGVYAKAEEDGTLVIRVLVSNPDWEEPLQIASIRSRPQDANCRTALGCNLDHINRSVDSKGRNTPREKGRHETLPPSSFA